MEDFQEFGFEFDQSAFEDAEDFVPGLQLDVRLATGVHDIPRRDYSFVDVVVQVFVLRAQSEL